MTPQERDASMDRLLREAIRADVRSVPGECLDIDTLAAWSDGVLGPAEQARAEAHASRCARCQATLAAMVRTDSPVETPSRAPFLRWVITLGPAVAAAAAVILWIAVDRRSAPPVLPERPAVSAGAPESKLSDAKNAPASRQAAPAEADSFRAAKKEVGAENRLDGRAPSSHAGELAGALKDRDERAGAVADAAKVAPKPADREREVMAASPRADAPASLPAPPPPPPAAPAPVARQAAEPTIPPVQTLDQVQAAQRQNAAPSQQTVQTQTGATANETVSGFTGDRRAFATELVVLDVRSPNPTVRWRVLDRRTVQQSVDGGQIWGTQYTVDTPTVILAGAAPSPSVCWLVGQGGLVLVTKDGHTWQRLKFPETVELRAVSASDANVASVVTADGRTFTTTNAGTSWTQK
jgi:hypothetical protein